MDNGKKRRKYWGKTGTYDAVAEYIQKNYCGLKDDIIKMLTGMRSPDRILLCPQRLYHPS